MGDDDDTSMDTDIVMVEEERHPKHKLTIHQDLYQDNNDDEEEEDDDLFLNEMSVFVNECSNAETVSIYSDIDSPPHSLDGCDDKNRRISDVCDFLRDSD